MNLQIGENIKAKRQELNMTQEELASHLGVSFQSVSRWENKLTYPDIEFLPLLAEIFGITVDTLIGVDKIQKDIKKQNYIEKFEKSNNPDEKLQVLRDALKEFPHDHQIMLKLADTLANIRFYENSNEHLNEIRKLCTAIWSESDDYEQRMKAIRIMTCVVDEKSELALWISRSQFGLGEYDLLMERYQKRNEWDEFEKTKERSLLKSVKNFCFNIRHRYYKSKNDGFKTTSEGSVMANTIALKLLDLVSDGGNRDAFIYEYAFYHTRLSAALFDSGNIDEGYKYMELAVEEILHWFDIPEGTEIPYGCYCFRDISYTKPKNTPFGFFTQSYGWEWFDCVRNEERYKALAEKVEAKNREFR